MTTAADSFHQGVQMELTHRVSQGLRTKFAYTFSKSIDDASGIVSPQNSGTPAMAQDIDNLRAEQGLSSFDVRHNLSMNAIYDLPGGGFGGIAAKLLRGWQLGGILTANTGDPLTVQTGFRRSRSLSRDITDRPTLRPGASNNPVRGGADRYYDPNAFELPPPGFYGNLGRNTLIGPGFVNVDFSLVKITPVGEHLKTEFRAEFFNLFNHANFGLPSLLIFSTNGTVRGAAGRIQATSNTSRQIQFGLKLSFGYRLPAAARKFIMDEDHGRVLHMRNRFANYKATANRNTNSPSLHPAAVAGRAVSDPL